MTEFTVSAEEIRGANIELKKGEKEVSWWIDQDNDLFFTADYFNCWSEAYVADGLRILEPFEPKNGKFSKKELLAHAREQYNKESENEI